MFLERRTISRKTPVDGKLEVSKNVARQLSSLDSALMLEWGGAREPARLAAMTCTCGGSDNPHEHHFVESELLKTLAIGAEVNLNLDVRGGILSLTAAA